MTNTLGFILVRERPFARSAARLHVGFLHKWWLKTRDARRASGLDSISATLLQFYIMLDLLLTGQGRFQEQ